MENKTEIKKYRKKPNIKIGTDPEFALMDKRGRIQNASQFNFFSSSHPTSKIGCDGAGTPVEIRPDAVDVCDIKSLEQDIRYIYSKIAGYLKDTNYHIEGGAMAGMGRSGNDHGLSIGAHIHFGGAEFKAEQDRFDRRYKPSENIMKQENVNRLVRCLNTYLTPIVNFFIDREEIAARRKTGYGKLGDWRRQPWGIEYRTPYCFLLTPLLTGGIYALSALIAFNYKKLNPDKNIYRDVALYYDMLTEPTAVRIQKSIYKKIKPKLISLLRFNSPNPAYNSKIISLFSLIEQHKTVKSKDILANFKTTPLTELQNKFTLHYGSGSVMRSLKDAFYPRIKNPNSGDLFLYRMSWDSWSQGRRKCIEITEGLPVKFNIPNIEIKKISNDLSKRRYGFYYSIGVNSHVVDWMYQTDKGFKIFTDYINNLKLRKINV